MHDHAWSSLTVFVVFKTAGGGDLDFGMEVHVNSFQQITKEDQHRNHGKHFHLDCVNIYKSNLTKVDQQRRKSWKTFALYMCKYLHRK